jgi:hypothetical protein
MPELFNRYLVIVNTKTGHIEHYGPWHARQDRDDFACALWFGKPARTPSALRGERIPFDPQIQNLYYVTVDRNLLGNFKNVTVGDLVNGGCFPRRKK